MSWALRFGLPTIPLTRLNTIRQSHRLFPHVTRACQGVIFESVEIVKDLMAKAKTQTGLSVFTAVLDKVYETGRKITEEFKQTMEIVFDDYLPQWNYTAKPQMS